MTKAERGLAKILRISRKNPELLKRCPALKWRVEVSLVGKKEMTLLNRRFLSKARPTDILSFPSHRHFHKQGVLGDLVICLPVLRTQARQQGHPAESELLILLTHGLLHLLHFDHEKSRASAKKMKKFETWILERALSKKVLAGLIERAEK